MCGIISPLMMEGGTSQYGRKMTYLMVSLNTGVLWP